MEDTSNVVYLFGKPEEKQPEKELRGLRSHADRELRLLGYSPDAEEGPAKWMYHNIMDLMQHFSDQGHSGFSAGIAIQLFTQLADYKPLSPLTGADDEWKDISDYGGSPTWQNRRCFSVFKDADGNCYDINGKIFREPSGACYTNQNSRVPVTFPYTPKQEYIDVPAENS